MLTALIGLNDSTSSIPPAKVETVTEPRVPKSNPSTASVRSSSSNSVGAPEREGPYKAPVKGSVQPIVDPNAVREAEFVSAITISTFKNGQPLGMRKTEAAELRNAAIMLAGVFQESTTPSYERLVTVAKGMTAKDRCFNLFSSRVAIASIEAGMLDASQNAEVFLKSSISSLEAINSQTQVTCEMR